MKSSLSVVIITLDEARNLPRCLSSVKDLATEVIVVDSGSRDATSLIATKAGARVIHQPFLGYGRQKQFALEQATGDWILSLDADEWLDEEARRNIADLLSMEGLSQDTAGFRLRCKNFFLGKWIHNGDLASNRKLRLTRRGHGRWGDDEIHESMYLIKGKSQVMDGHILHFPDRDLGHHLRTLDHYTELIAQRDLDTSWLRIWLGMVFEPPLVFLNKYFLQRGILDGRVGFVVSILGAFYFFLRYAKIWQYKKRLDMASPDP